MNKAKKVRREAGGKEVWESTEQRNDLSIAQTTGYVRGFLWLASPSILFCAKHKMPEFIFNNSAQVSHLNKY